MREQDVRLLMDAEPEGHIAPGWQAGVIRQRARTIRAGRHLYLDAYPIWDTARTRQAEDAAKRIKERNPEVKRRCNARRAQRYLGVLLNANFGPGDTLATFTYPDCGQPASVQAAQRDAVNLIGRLKRLYRRQGIQQLRYVYVIEMTQSVKRGTRYHIHMVLSGGVSREAVEDAWSRVHRGICNTRRAQQLREGLTGWACYITKTVQGRSDQVIATRRKWCASKNLIRPRASIADKRVSRRRVEQIAAEMAADRPVTRAILERLYPGYEMVECEVRVSEWVTGAYISAMMVRRE